MMSEIISENITTFQGDPFEVAAVVSTRVKLETITLVDSQTWRDPDLKFPSENSFLLFDIEQISHGKEFEGNKVFVKISFASQDSVDENRNPDSFFVKATFVLMYAISSFNGVEEPNIFAFAVTTGIYNAWPYWREFLQSTTTRMGLPSVIAPPFRFEPKVD